MAASAKILGDLHKHVAQAFTEQVVGYTEEVERGDKLVTVTVRPSPALLGAAVAFLKNNNVTADPETNASLSKLKDTLAARRKGHVSPAVLDAAAESYAAHMGGGILQ